MLARLIAIRMISLILFEADVAFADIRTPISRLKAEFYETCVTGAWGRSANFDLAWSIGLARRLFTPLDPSRCTGNQHRGRLPLSGTRRQHDQPLI
jgi:hypothetical protein